MIGLLRFTRSVRQSQGHLVRLSRKTVFTVDSDIPQRLPVKVGKETMAGKTVNALCPIDSSGGKVFAKDEYCTATSDTLVEIALEGLTTKVHPET